MRNILRQTHKLFVALLLISSAIDLSAQLVTIPAANTNGTGVTATNARKPYGCYFGYERTALIYLQSEIGTTGNINSVGFYVNAIAAPAASTPVNIYMKQTSVSDFTVSGTDIATEFAGATLVYSGNVLASELLTGQWITKTLTTPFNYTGGNNLEILVEANFGGTGGEGSADKTFRCDNSSTPNYRFQYWLQDNSAPTGLGTTTFNRTNVQLNFAPSAACTGQPTAGNTISSVNPVCPSQNFTLSVSGANSNTGITYQWISSTSGTSYSNIGAAINSTYSASQTNATYYRCIVTCSNSGLSDTSVALQVTMNTLANCYCTVTSNCGVDDEIDTVIFAGINNYTSCTTGGYTFYNSPSASVQLSNTYPISVYVTNGGTESVGVWIDYDHSGTFDASEYTFLGSATGGVFFNGNITIPANAVLGNTIMRIRDKFGSTTITSADACQIYTYGETEDYVVNISGAAVCATPPVGGVATGPATGVVDAVYNYSVAGSTGNIQWQYSTTSATGPFTDIIGSNASTAQLIFNGAATFWIRAYLTSPGCSPDSSNAVQTVVTLPGDDVCDAVTLNFGTNGYFNTYPATTQAGEPTPPATGCRVLNGWCDSTITNTLWFKFIAPASGRVRIQSPDFDTQLALWDAQNCASILTGGAILVAANDDDSLAVNHGGVTWSSYIDSAICLTPGKTYYVQLDAYSNPANTGDSTRIILTDLGAGPNASFTNLAATYCVTAPAVTLTPTTTGGTFTGTGITGSTFTPATAGVGGPYIITYALYACYKSSDTVTNVNNGPSISVTGITAVSCNAGNDGAIDISVSGGSGNYTYNWSNNLHTEDISGLTATSYTVSVIDNNSSCSATSGALTVSEPTALTPTLDSVVNVKCHGAATGGIYISITGGTTPYTYNWSNGTHNQDLTGVVSGSYSGTVIDAHGCTYSSPTVPITEPTAIVVTLDSTYSNLCSANNGAVYITVSGGTAGYSYSWSNSATWEDITGLTSGTYIVTVTDANACIAAPVSGTVVSVNPLTITVNAVTDVNCHSGNTGAIDVSVSNGSGNYTYNWSNGTHNEDASALTAGSYTLTAIDNGNTCSAASSAIVVTEPDTLIVTLDSLVNVKCHGSNTGGIYLTLVGGTLPYTFNWSNGTHNEDLTGVGAGFYSGTVTDNKGCTISSLLVPITEPAALTLAYDSVHSVLCHGDANGAVYITIAGGTAPYSPVWSNNTTLEDNTGLIAGTYTVTVTDANACTVAPVSGTVNDAVAINFTLDSVIAVACFGENNGAVYTTLSGGTGSTSIVWSNSSSTADIIGLVAGTYVATVTDANGCTATVSGTVTAPSSALTVSSVSTDQNQGTNNGAVNVAINGGTGPYASQWSNNATTENISNLAAGIYSCTITDTNGCTVTITDTVNLITGITNLQNSFAVNVYPNPTQAQVFIDLSLTATGNVSVEVYNIDGQLVRLFEQKNILTAKFEVNFATEAAGVYFAKIKAGDATITKRIVVAK